MLLFITSEVMFFAGLFAAYFSIRAGYTELIGGQPVHVWPPTQFENLLNPFALTTESGDLNLILPATIILVVSSFTCQMGVWSIRQDDRTGFLRNFGITPGAAVRPGDRRERMALRQGVPRHRLGLLGGTFVDRFER